MIYRDADNHTVKRQTNNFFCLLKDFTCLIKCLKKKEHMAISNLAG